MRYAVIHCRNPQCSLKVWVPANRLGVRGKCPLCGQPIVSPRHVPDDELLEGPPLLEMEQNGEQREPVAQSA
jgi:hypothetical protein